MPEQSWKDVDYLAARVHGRRSRLAEGPILDRLCLIRTVPELARALNFPPDASPLGLQRTLVLALFEELSQLAERLPDPAGEVLAWMRVRFQVENLKVLARGAATGRSIETLEPHLLPLPGDLRLPRAAGAALSTPDDILEVLPPGPLRESLEELTPSDRVAPPTFFLEAALDRGYFRELLRRAALISGSEGREVAPLVYQEVDAFHLMLAARGIWIHHLDPTRLLPLFVDGAGLLPREFGNMLRAPDLTALAQGRMARRVLDAVPASVEEPDLLEILAWNRLRRLANQAFRRSHMGPAAVVAFTTLRRIELANLITLSEGIRAGVEPAVLRARLIPRALVEAAHA